MKARLPKRHNGEKRAVHNGNPDSPNHVGRLAENDFTQFIFYLKKIFFHAFQLIDYLIHGGIRSIQHIRRRITVSASLHPYFEHIRRSDNLFCPRVIDEGNVLSVIQLPLIIVQQYPGIIGIFFGQESAVAHARIEILRNSRFFAPDAGRSAKTHELFCVGP